MKHIAQVKVLCKHMSKTCGRVMLRDHGGPSFCDEQLITCALMHHLACRVQVRWQGKPDLLSALMYYAEEFSEE